MKQKQAKRDLNLPPTPPGYLVVGNLIEVARSSDFQFYRRYSQRYDGAFRFQVLNQEFFVFNKPEYVEEILVNQRANFIKGAAFAAFRKRFGNGILFSDGELWTQHRRLVQPAFHRDLISNYAQIMSECSLQTLQRWRVGQSIDLYQELINLTFDIVVKTLFERSEVITRTTLLREALRRMFREFEGRRTKTFSVPLKIPTAANQRYQAAFEDLDKALYQLISELRETPLSAINNGTNSQSRRDILSILMEARSETGEALSDQELHDEALTLFFAGHETTANALSWIFYLLSQHPSVEQKLLEELNRILGSSSEDSLFPLEKMTDLIYTRQIINEALRLYPPAWVLARNAVTNCRVGEYEVPGGANVIVMPLVVQRDPAYFEEPDKFKPERWSAEFTSQLPKFAYFPFGGGPRQCLGSNFALLEVTVVLSMVLRRFHLALVPEQKIQPTGSFTLRPKFGLKMLLDQRTTAPKEPLNAQFLPEQPSEKPA